MTPTSSPPPLPLDERGILPGGEWIAALPSRSYLVFAQLRDARIDDAAWSRHARQFFGAELRLTRPKEYGAVAPARDAAHLAVDRPSRSKTVRSVFLRPREDDDLARAERVDTGGGLLLLARRCPYVALVGAVSPEGDDEDALFLAAVVAGVVLGPILAANGEWFAGVKSARERSARIARGAR